MTGSIASPQQDDSIKSLQDKITEHRELFKTDPDKAFSDTILLLEEAVSQNDNLSELILLGLRCWYYHYRLDIDNLIHAAQFLRKKAIEYKNRPFEATAHTYLLCAYAANHLYDKSTAEFNRAMAILGKEDAEDPKIIIAKTNARTYLTNLYIYREDYEKALLYLLPVSKELEKLKNSEQKKELQYQNYSNIALCYLKINPDSSKYYVEKSICLKPENPSHNVTFLNYTLLGDIYRKKKKYREALVYFHKAEATIQENSKNNIVNQEELFKGLQEIYEVLADTVNANHYQLRLKEAELEIAQSKNKSLHKILEDNSKSERARTYFIVSVISFIFICIVVVFIYRLQRKNKLLQEQERKSREYLNAQDEAKGIDNNREQLYKDLVRMVEQDDPAFMEEFLKTFPGFVEKLHSINPSLMEIDVELCALLKLSMPTKEIARWKNISPRTVQNRKYRLRKRLNIQDNNIDIYYWFSQF